MNLRPEPVDVDVVRRMLYPPWFRGTPGRTPRALGTPEHHWSGVVESSEIAIDSV